MKKTILFLLLCIVQIYSQINHITYEVTDDFERNLDTLTDYYTTAQDSFYYQRYSTYGKMVTDGHSAVSLKPNYSCNAIYIPDTFGTNQIVRVIVGTNFQAGNIVYINIHTDTAYSSGYKFYCRTDSIILYETGTIRTKAAWTLSAGDTVVAYSYGDTMYAYLNSTLAYKIYENTYRGRQCGFGTFQTTTPLPQIEEWSAGEYIPPAPCDSIEQIGFTDSTTTTLIYKSVSWCAEATDTAMTLFASDTTEIDTILHFNVEMGDTIRDTFTGLTPSTKYWGKSVDSTSISLWDTIWTADSVDTIDISDPPAIDSIIGPDSCVVGDTLIVAYHAESPHSWYIDDSLMTIIGTIGDTIDSVLVNQVPSGSRYLKIVTISGLRDSIPIVVYAPVTITSHPQDTTFFTGGVYSTSVTATSDDTVHYSWIFNGEVYGDDTNTITTTALDTSYDSSLVYCIVFTNEGGIDTSDTAVIRVIQPMVVDSVGIRSGVYFKMDSLYTVDSVKVDGEPGISLIQTDSTFEFTPPFPIMWSRDIYIFTMYYMGLSQNFEFTFRKSGSVTIAKLSLTTGVGL